MPDDTVPLEPGRRRLDAYEPIVGAKTIKALRKAARPLEGLRVTHLTAPPFAPAAIDLLQALVPLLNELGLRVRWRGLPAGGAAGRAAQAIGDALRGGELAVADADLETWREQEVDVEATDVLVLHDPETLAAAAPPGVRTVWRTHGDLSAANAEAWVIAGPLAHRAQTWVVTHADFAAERGRGSGSAAAKRGRGSGSEAAGGPADPFVIAPALDPLATRHLELPPRVTGAFARAAGLDLTRPCVCQVADLDAWSDPESAIDAWLAAREAGADGLQLALVARVAHNDERAWQAIGELSEYAGEQDDVRVIADVAGHGDGAVNAVQRLSRVALQGGRGYGIAIAEALWKGTPAVAAPGPGASEDLVDGAGGGFVADSPSERGARIAELVADTGLAVELARAGRQRVLKAGLVTRAVADELDLLARVAGTGLA